MKISMTTEKKVRVLSKSANQWNMDGRSGVTYKVGIRVDGDIEKVKVSPELYARLDIDQDYLIAGTLDVSGNNTRFLFDTLIPEYSKPQGK